MSCASFRSSWPGGGAVGRSAVLHPLVLFFDPRQGRPPTHPHLRGRARNLSCRPARQNCRQAIESSIHFPANNSKPSRRRNLRNINRSSGSDAVDGLNEALLAKAAERSCCAAPGSGSTPPSSPSHVAYPDRPRSVRESHAKDRVPARSSPPADPARRKKPGR